MFGGFKKSSIFAASFEKNGEWVRIHACHAWGREFESRPDRNKGSRKASLSCFKSASYRGFSPRIKVFCLQKKSNLTSHYKPLQAILHFKVQLKMQLNFLCNEF